MPVILQSGYVFQGDSKALPKIVTNSKLGSFVFKGTSWDWSNLVFSGSANTLQFVPDPNDGGLQGDFSIGTGSVTSAYPNKQSTFDFDPNKVFELEPAGGTGYFDLKARELTYTWKFGPILASYQYTKSDNYMEFIEGKFLFTGISNSYRGVNHTTVYPENKSEGSTYIQYHYLDVLRSSVSLNSNNWTNKPVESSSTDYTVSFSIGPNNTPEAAYTEVRFIGFSNEALGWEYFEPSSSFGTIKLNHPRAVPFTNEENQRSLPDASLPKEFTLLKVWQKPNILYYAHLKFINLDYTDYDNPPSNANVLEHWYSNWDVKRREILLYIEFGVSPNGGKTIWWNGLESNPNIGGTIGAKLVARGITTIVPNDINKYLTATLLNYSTKPGNVNGKPEGESPDNRYNISTSSATVHGTNTFKYVRIPIWTDLPNDEYANNSENTIQKYQCINFSDVQTNTTATHNEDIGIDASTKRRSDEYWAKYQENSESAEKFQIGRKNRTNNWRTDIHIDLFYKKYPLKYKGSTDGKTVTSKLTS